MKRRRLNTRRALPSNRANNRGEIHHRGRFKKTSKRSLVSKAVLADICQTVAPIVDVVLNVMPQTQGTINTVFPPLQAAGSRGFENANAFIGNLLGGNGNICFGLKPDKYMSGVVLVKCWQGLNTKSILALNANAFACRNVTTPISATVGASGAYLPLQAAGAASTGFPLYDNPIRWYQTVTNHTLKNFTNFVQRVRVVHYKCVKPSSNDPLQLWANDLGSRGQRDTSANLLNLELRPQLDEILYAQSANSTAAPPTSGPFYSSDYYQSMYCLLNTTGRLLTPDNGCKLFNYFYRVTKVKTYVLTAGQSVTFSHTQPGFTWNTTDQYASYRSDELDGVDTLNNTQFNPKWSSGVIMLAVGEPYAIPIDNTNASDFAKYQPPTGEAENILPPHLHHSYQTRFRSRAWAPGRRNQTTTIGSMPSAASANVPTTTGTFINDESDTFTFMQSG